MFLLLKISWFYFGNIFVDFCPNFTVFERILPVNYYLQVVVLVDGGNRLKVRSNAMVADDASVHTM